MYKKIPPPFFTAYNSRSLFFWSIISTISVADKKNINVLCQEQHFLIVSPLAFLGHSPPDK